MAACLGAALAMLRLVFVTLGAAGIADFRAHSADFWGEMRIATHE
jgi:hypothetical protein